MFISFTEVMMGSLISYCRPVEIINAPKAFSHKMQDKRRIEVWGGISISLTSLEGYLFTGISQNPIP